MLRYRRCIPILFLGFAPLVSAQVRFAPVFTRPPEFVQITDTGVFVKGFWVPLDKESKLAGPSTTELSCDRHEGLCNELQVNVHVDGKWVEFVPDAIEYKIVRWNADEIVARNVQGICKVASTIKIDRKAKRIFFLQALSEPVEGLPELTQKICNAVGLRLELHAATPFEVTK